MEWIKSSASRKFVEKFNQQSTGEGFRKLLNWPGANPSAMELLSAMLQFDPSRRISVEDAVHHAYLASFNASEDNEVTTALGVRPMDWTFDRNLCFDEAGQARP